MVAATQPKIHDVWKGNLEEEFTKIRKIAETHPYIAMDTEFPGVVATPVGQFRSKEDFNYQQVSCNVNMLKLIQVGFSFFDRNGQNAAANTVWQFNFRFDLHDDMYSEESVNLLKSAGIDFNRNKEDGIRMEDFGELLTTSGLVVNKNVTWLTFHSGYDFGYLIRTMLLRDLPTEEAKFFKYHRTFFPKSYDIKMLLRQPATVNAKLRGGLQEVADQLQVERIGPNHQAGSDSLLTGLTFFKIKERFFSSDWDQVEPLVQGDLFGLGDSLSKFSHFLHSQGGGATDQTLETDDGALTGGDNKSSSSNSPIGSQRDSMENNGAHPSASQ